MEAFLFACMAFVATLTVTLSDAANLTYAPVPKGNVGTKALACVGISYTDPINDYVTASRCLKSAKAISEFYGRNSGNKLKLIPAGYHMNYDGAAWKSFTAAEKVAKRNFKASYYIIPSIFRNGGNHASGGIAHVTQMTTWVIEHEVGHLIGLPHSGRYIYDKAGKPHYEQYGDNDSPMGNNGYRYLTGPEYYGMGWLDKQQVALYIGNATQTFTLTQLDDGQAPGNPLIGVLVQFKNKRDAFISYPASCVGCVALHLTELGTKQSALVKFSDKTKGELYDGIFTGLHVKVLEYTRDIVKISVDYNNPEI